MPTFGGSSVSADPGRLDGPRDANSDIPISKYKNAFFATFSPAFWANVEDVREDGMAITDLQTLVYALDAGTGNLSEKLCKQARII